MRIDDAGVLPTGQTQTMDDVAEDDIQIAHVHGCACAACSNEPDLDTLDLVPGRPGVGNGAPIGSLSELSDYLANGFWQDTNGRGSAFNVGDDGLWAKGGVLTYNLSGYSARGRTDADGLTDDRRDLARDAFALYEEVLGIRFVENTSSQADLLFSDNASGAFAGAGGYQGTSLYAIVNVAEDWDRGRSDFDTYTFQTFLHEIGHALGLGHQGNYNGSGRYSDADFANDSWHVSMMSYFHQGQNTLTTAAPEFLQTPMAADWLALETLYGGQSSGGKVFGTRNAFDGDTVWGFNTNITATVSEVWADFSTYAGRTASTIIDADGRDTLDLSGFSANQRIDLTVTRASDTTPTSMDVGGSRENLTLAVGTVIENAVGGAGNDRLTGNEANNILRGQGGNDLFFDTAGADTYLGGSGTDEVIFDFGLSDYDVTFSGGFLEVVRTTVGNVVDLVEDTVEWLTFGATTLGFGDLAVRTDPLPDVTISSIRDDAGSQTGTVRSGGATNDSTPTLTGTLDKALPPGAEIVVARDGTALGTARVEGSTWSFADDLPADGTYAYTVAVRSGDRVGATSDEYRIDLDTAAPTISISSVTTSDRSPALSGDVDDPNAIVVVTVGGTERTATNNGDGTWALAADALPDLSAGRYDVSVRAVDAVGNASDVVVRDALVVQAPAPSTALMEFGSDMIEQAAFDVWTRIDFTETIENAVVVLGGVTLNGGQALAPRIRNVEDTGFEVYLQEYAYRDGYHMAETVSWVAVSEGVHDIGGLTVAAGTGRSASNEREASQGFGMRFEDEPVVFAQIAGDADAAAAVTRVRDIDTEGFKFRVEEEEAGDGRHASEAMTWIAFEAGDGVAFDVARTGNSVTEKETTVTFDPTDDPVFLSGMQTRDGADPANIRVTSLTDASARFFIDEEVSQDGEIAHTTEVVGYVVAEEGVWLA